jgi:hypothetical protein
VPVLRGPGVLVEMRRDAALMEQLRRKAGMQGLDNDILRYGLGGSLDSLLAVLPSPE